MKVKINMPTPELIEAIRAGIVDGDVYRDGEVWVETNSYTNWRVGPDAINA